MRAIFRDPAVQGLFEHQGYVQLELLDASDIEALTSLYDRNAADMPQSPASYSAASTDAGLRLRISRGIRAVLQPRVDGVLERCRVVLGHFFHKQPSSPASQFRMHQDWYFVDESQHHSLSIWCPMVEVNEANGTLAVVPGSHHLTRHARGFGTGFPFTDLEPIVRAKYSRQLAMKPGQAVFFHQRLFHWSGPNRDQNRRLATNCFVAPEEAAIVFPHTDSRAHPGQIELFAADEGLLTSFVLGVRPAGARSLGLVDASIEPLDEAALHEILGPYAEEAPQSAIPAAVAARAPSAVST